MRPKPKFFMSSWSVTQKTLDELEAGCQILDTENASYTLRKLVSEGLESLRRKNQAESLPTPGIQPEAQAREMV